MLNRKPAKIPLNISEENIISKKTSPIISKKPNKPVVSELDKLITQSMGKTSNKSAQILSSLNESGSYINEVSANLFNKLGIITVNSGISSSLSLVKRVDMYLTRFPEIEYLIDMIASSIIYTSSSNTKKIQVAINGEHKSIPTQKPTAIPETDTALEEPKDVEYDPSAGDVQDLDTLNYTEATDGLSAPNIDQYNDPTNTATIENTEDEKDITELKDTDENENIEKVDSYYKDMSIQIGNLFKKNNIKLSLYNLVFSILKYGFGVFYYDNSVKFDSVSFYGLDEIKFVEDKKEYSNSYITASLDGNSNEYEDIENIFESADTDDHIKILKSSTIKIYRLEDGIQLKNSNLYFVAEKGIFGKSLVDKVINYLKIIELLELSLLVERLSKAKTTHVWKLDLAKIEEEDVASTLLLYRNLINSKSSMNFDEESDQMSFDIVKNLVDSNLLVPTESDNLKIETLKSEYKPLLDDIDYWWDKVYHTMGIPLHYRKVSGAKTYVNSNMLSLHDNVYSMKIRHWQVILNNLLTFWIDKWVSVNYKELTIKFLNVNIPEFIPISERRETDLDKSAKFVTMFTQLEQMLGINIKDEFIINKLFPNDIMSDIIDNSPIDNAADVEEEAIAPDQAVDPETEDDITALFESGLDALVKKKKRKGRKPYNLFNTTKKRNINNVYSWNFDMNIDW